MHKSFWLFFLMLLTSSVCAVITEDSMPIFAVLEGENNAIAANLTIHLIPGKGEVFTSVSPFVGPSTQASQKEVVSFLKRELPNIAKKYDYLFEIRGDAKDVDGPSAGAAMSLLAYSMLQDKNFPNHVAITGTVSKEGYVGKVGGVFYKAKKAAEIGIKLFLIPKGESKQTVVIDNKVQTIYLPDYAYKKWGMIVKEVSTIKEAYNLAFSNIANISPDTEQSSPLLQLEKENPYINSDLEQVALKYMKKAKQAISSAEKQLSTKTKLSNKNLAVISSKISAAHNFLDGANSAFSKKYFYSAASLALGSLIDAEYSLELIENPDFAEKDERFLTAKIISLDNEYNKFAKNIKENFNSSCLYYSIGAVQRYAWGKSILSSVLNQKKSQPYLALYSYIEAKERLEVANDLFALSLSCQPFAPAQQPVLESEWHNKKSKILSLLKTEEDKKAFSKDLKMAELLKNEGFYPAALLKLGEIEAELQTENINKDLPDLKKLAEKELNFSPKTKWGKIYLSHAFFYYQQALFYEKQNDKASAKQYFYSSILFSKYSKQYDSIYFNIINKTSFPAKIEVFPGAKISFEPLAIILMLFFFSMSAFVIYLMKKTSFSSSLDKEQILLRRQFSEGKISQQEYLARAKLLEQMEREQLSRNLKKSKTNLRKYLHSLYLKQEIKSTQTLLSQLQRKMKEDKDPLLKKEYTRLRRKLRHLIKSKNNEN